MGKPLSIPAHMRPRYTDQTLWDEILTAVAHGASFTRALSEHPGAPSYPVAKRYIAADPALAAAYKAAQEDRADTLVDQLLELADAPIPSDLDSTSKAAWIAHAKLRIETRRYLASKLFPRCYADRMSVDVDVSQRISITAALAAAERRVIDGSSI